MRVLRILSEALFSEDAFAVLAEIPLVSIEWTGAGYFATATNPLLPVYGDVQSAPLIVGHVGDLYVGFVVYVSNHRVTLECHAWGDQTLPENFRDLDVQLSLSGMTI